MLLKFLLIKSPENTIDSQENQLIDNQTNQPRFLTQGRSDQAKINLLWTHYGMTRFSGTSSNAGDGRRKKQRMTTVRKMDLVKWQ